jgi:hypothetical protein
MAIRINITANISNLKQVRSQLEKKLKNVKMDVNAKGLKQSTELVNKLINQYRAGERSAREFLTLAEGQIKAFKNQEGLLKEKARLTQYIKKVQKEHLASLNQELQVYKVQKSAKTLKGREAEYKKEAAALRVLAEQGKRGALSTKELADRSNVLIESLKRQEKEIESLGGKTRNLVEARKKQETQIKDIIK